MENLRRRPAIRSQQHEGRSKVLVLGEFKRNEIVTTEGKDFAPVDEGQKKKINEMWEGKEEKGYFSGPLVCVNSFELSSDGKLELSLGKTNFKDYMGTRDGVSLCRYGFEGIANPLTADVVLITSDEKMILGKKTSGDAEGRLVTFGGHADPGKDKDENGVIDVYKTAERELKEELGLDTDQIEEAVCLGLTSQYGDKSSPVAIFAIKTSLTAEEVMALEGEENEGDIVVANPNHIPNKTIASAMQDDTTLEMIVPDGRVSIALARKWLQGTHYPKRVIHLQDQ